MKKFKKVRISQCMITKNEEENMERALSWGKGTVCEQIVVDTGSTDRTVEIAEAMGAKVFRFPWTGDFAAAKNFALSKATGEWIAFLDADESFVPGDEKKIEMLLAYLKEKKMKADAVMVACQNLNDQGKVFSTSNLLRVFRNDPKLRYHRRIHEKLEWENGCCTTSIDATKEITLIHTGYAKKVMEKKRGRNLELIQKELEENPTDYQLMGYLGDEYWKLDKYDDAMFWYERVIDNIPQRTDDGLDQRIPITFASYMELLWNVKHDEKKFKEVYEKACAMYPEEPDFDYLYGSAMAQQKRYEEGKQYLSQALNKLETFGICNRGLYLGANIKKAYVYLAMCCLETGETNRAVSLCVEVLKTEFENIEALRVLLKAFHGKGATPAVSPEQIMTFMAKLCNIHGLRERYWIQSAAKQIDYQELALYMDTLFSEEEKEALKNAGLLNS